MARRLSLGFVTGFGLGVGVGAGIMYFLDPDRGRRRRSLARDQVVHMGHQSRALAAKKSLDLSHRIQGIIAEGFAQLRNEPVDDSVLKARIRSNLGHVSPHTHALDVEVTEGKVRLRGTAPKNEIKDILECVSRTRGVLGVINEIETRDKTGGSPEPQVHRKIDRTDLH